MIATTWPDVAVVAIIAIAIAIASIYIAMIVSNRGDRE